MNTQESLFSLLCHLAPIALETLGLDDDSFKEYAGTSGERRVLEIEKILEQIKERVVVSPYQGIIRRSLENYKMTDWISTKSDFSSVHQDLRKLIRGQQEILESIQVNLKGSTGSECSPLEVTQETQEVLSVTDPENVKENDHLWQKYSYTLINLLKDVNLPEILPETKHFDKENSLDPSIRKFIYALDSFYKKKTNTKKNWVTLADKFFVDEKILWTPASFRNWAEGANKTKNSKVYFWLIKQVTVYTRSQR